MLHTGTNDERLGALARIRQLLPIAGSDELIGLADDLDAADSLIAKAVSQGSWARNASWIEKFVAYVQQKCPGMLDETSIAPALQSDAVIIAFLAHVHSRSVYQS